jgi:hypothetical protein
MLTWRKHQKGWRTMRTPSVLLPKESTALVRDLSHRAKSAARDAGNIRVPLPPPGGGRSFAQAYLSIAPRALLAVHKKWPRPGDPEWIVGDPDNDGQTAHRPGNGTTTTRTSGSASSGRRERDWRIQRASSSVTSSARRRAFLRGWLHDIAPRRRPPVGNYAVIPARRAQQAH